jgi:hypothetical protein
MAKEVTPRSEASEPFATRGAVALACLRGGRQWGD